MIPVSLPDPPEHYRFEVRARGRIFLAGTPHPTSEEWNCHNYWREIHMDLYQWHQGVCVYCASWTPRPSRQRVSDHTTIDHFVPKNRNAQLAYEWSNFRLVRSKLNRRKDIFEDVIDPCALQSGWFRLNFTTFMLEPDVNISAEAQIRIATTISRLQLNDDPAYVTERARVVFQYAAGKIAFGDVQRLYPFIASEMIAKNFDAAIRPTVIAALARRPSLVN
jgi:uncharacterized protein (TIGR02646 family)